MNKLNKISKKYWNNRPCNINHSKKKFLTKEYFDKITKKRYFVEPHIKKFADFNNYKNKNILEIAEKANTLIKEIIIDKYHFNKDFSKSTVINKSKLKHCEIHDFRPDIEIKTLIDKENTLNIQANFYCYINDKKDIEQLYIKELLKEIKLIHASSL